MVIKPAALRPGSTLGIVAPSSWSRPDALARGVRVLKGFGYRVKLFVPPARDGDFAGPDAARARLFNRAFADRVVDAVFCARGGYGALRMLGGVDVGLIRRHPKILVGFSDITVLQLALWKAMRLVTFYGPMVAFRSPPYNWRHLWRALSSSRPAGAVPIVKPHQPVFLRPGRATGRILGGTISLVSKLVGTPYLPSFRGAILFLEDVGEKPHKVDGYLAHLRLAGILDRVAGVILANFKRCRSRSATQHPVERIIHDHFRRAPYPVATGFPFGHLDPMFTLPQGVRATLDSRSGTLVLLEGGVR